MRSIVPEEILPPEKYSRIRESTNIEIAGIEKKRRVSTRTFSFLFENRDIVLNQITEMVYLENIRDPEEIRQLIEIYSEQLPSKGVLSVTMFIELPDERTMISSMKKLSGVEKNVFMTFENGEIHAEYEEGRSTETLESTLQYLKFRFDQRQVQNFLNSRNVHIDVRHPEFEESARIGEELLEILKKEILEE
ncbi:MAG: DUF3501 family protein [Candidatus Thermoplasmatota archaeon]|nr:DUF3501 family protein [Candidatus Thermoplasmatota archaeon]MCL5731732.1 DUF3501 family protein [Candidatus Thermoplasmatota archaeon]